MQSINMIIFPYFKSNPKVKQLAVLPDQVCVINEKNVLICNYLEKKKYSNLGIVGKNIIKVSLSINHICVLKLDQFNSTLLEC